MNETFAKLIAIGLVAGVAKSLFGQPTHVFNQTVEAVKDATAGVAKAAKG